MYDSPDKLQERCVSYICENVDAVCEVKEDPNDPTLSKCEFKGEVFLHSRIADQLLEQWSVSGKLTDSLLQLFHPHRTKLRNVVVKNSPVLSLRGLEILKHHNVVLLTAEDLRSLTVEELVTCLNEWTLKNLYHLGVANSALRGVDQTRFPFANFENLRSLDVSRTEFDGAGLENCAKRLPLLESLDLSNTSITDLSPLKRLAKTLKSLSLYKMSLDEAEPLEELLFCLEKLKVLDISDDPKERTPDDRLSVRRIVRRPEAWPALVYLDVSGRPLENAMDKDEQYLSGLKPSDADADLQKMLSTFISCHKNLTFLGLALTEASQYGLFTDPTHVGFEQDLAVTGEATEKQVLLSLSTYVSRSHFMQKTLYFLFHLTQGLTEARHDVVSLLFPVMKRHRVTLPVQLAATACLYNLIRQDLSSRIHPSCLSKVVDATLDAMETHPRHQQLQKNTLLTLCSDKILQEIEFNRYRCTKLVLDCLCQFDDASMNRMCVAICGILAAKITTKETSRLGSRPRYMTKLLQLVKQSLDGGQVDVTLKFTLSALWNLTDESPSTCVAFLKEGGLDLFVKLLNVERFANESSVETKVLGLLNNLAEVEDLRSELLRIDFIQVLSSRMLASEHIDVSYFAAGILSHLAMSEEWTVEESLPRATVLAQLQSRVVSWKNPDGEMVAYRSFKPFFKLLLCSMPEVQLWAIWAIRHVCTKNPHRYCPMLKEEGGEVILKEMKLVAAEPLSGLLDQLLGILDCVEKGEEISSR